MRHSSAARWVLGVLAAIATVAVTSTPAWAHAELLASDPAYGDRREVAPPDVRLEFSEAIRTTGARLELRRAGAPTQALSQPKVGSPDRRVVLVPLPAALPAATYVLAYFFLGDDGHLMAGEVVFSVGLPPTPTASSPTAPASPAPAAPVAPNRANPPAEARSLGPGIASPALVTGGDEGRPPDWERSPPPPPFRLSVGTAQAVVRFVDYTSLVVLIGGGLFLALVWRDGAGLQRSQRLLWAALGGSALAAFLTYGLTAAGLQGLSAFDAVRPSVLGDVAGTRFAHVMTARAAFLGLGAVALALLALGRERAALSRWWQGLAALAGGGVLATRTLLGHASGEGLPARLALFVHLAGVALWLGGLIMLVAVVLPQGSAVVRTVLPRFSRVAFTAVCGMLVAGAVTLNRVVPTLSQLPTTGYGRVLLLKLGFVALLLVAAQQARTFTERRLVLSQPSATDTSSEPVRLRPLLMAVGAELSIAVAILSATTVLAGRPPPAAETKPVATPAITAPDQPLAPKGR